jgi:hypothetical protein
MQTITYIIELEKMHLLYTIWDIIGTCHMQRRIAHQSRKYCSNTGHVGTHFHQRIVQPWDTQGTIEGSYELCKGCCTIGKVTVQGHKVYMEPKNAKRHWTR